MLLIWKARFLPAEVPATVLYKFIQPLRDDGVKFKNISDGAGVFPLINFIKIC